jgi:hypothetical protein
MTPPSGRTLYFTIEFGSIATTLILILKFLLFFVFENFLLFTTVNYLSTLSEPLKLAAAESSLMAYHAVLP